MKVTVTVTNRQRMDGESAVTTLSAVGTWENGVLRYETTEEGVTDVTTLTVTPQKVVMERRGQLTSRLVFEPGLTHSCPYGTPYGQLELPVTTHRLKAALTAHGGTLALAYTLDAGGSLLENQLNLTIKEVS